MRRHRGALWRVAALAAVSPAALALLSSGSCSLVQLYDGMRDAGGGAPSADSGGTDAGSDGDAPSCPLDMVEIPNGVASYCIDRLEVTNQAYAEFLTEVDAAAPHGPPGKCDWNVDYAPAVAVSAGADLPVLGVDWCDAYAYCIWANKRLCGAMDGGPLAPDRRDVYTDDEWFNACSHRNTESYPYGLQFDIAKCADCDPEAGCDEDASQPSSAPVAVGSKAGCQGGYAGIFDMSGNAGEWEDVCDDSGLEPDAAGVPDPRYDVCYHRGGSFEYPRQLGSAQDCLVCASTYCTSSGSTRRSRPLDVGLRCCRAL
jgi:formylglycine-generating enzyme required for sulfatase activity